MGNSTAKGNDFIDSFTKNYIYEKDLNDVRLGEVKIYNRMFDEKDQVALKVYPRLEKINQISAFTAFLNENGNLIGNQNYIIKNLKMKINKTGTSQNDNINLIKLYAFKVSADEELTLYYEYCYTNIQQQIEMRLIHGCSFSAEELWRTILSVVMAGHFLEKQNRHIGDVNTKRIYINKKGIVKVAPYMQSQSDIDNFKRAGFFNEYGYLSPECLEKFKQRDMLASINFIKNDVFGLGISILEMATLKNSSNLYDWNKYEIKQNLLQKIKEEAKLRYGEYFSMFVEKMLIKDPYQRSSFSDLYKDLYQYQQQIITGIGFSDIKIFNSGGINNNLNNISLKIENHSKQQALTSSQLQGQITKNVDNLPFVYQIGDQRRQNNTQFQKKLNIETTQAVQLNLSQKINFIQINNKMPFHQNNHYDQKPLVNKISLKKTISSMMLLKFHQKVNLLKKEKFL